MKNIGIKNIITGIFVIGAAFGLLIFSGVVKLGGDQQQAVGTVTVWGTIASETIEPYMEYVRTTDLTVNYVAKRPQTYENDLINAFASGTGPDLFLMSHEGLIRNRDKVFEIPFDSFSRESYEQLYIDESRLFLTSTGSTALPLTVDPLIMYYNKSLLSSSFILDIPSYWDEFIEFAPQITESTASGELVLSAVALGTFDNIPHAKSIIATLLMQNGNPIVGNDEFTNKKVSTLAGENGAYDASREALDFYTSFAEFGSNTYSWNEALVDARNKFIAGELAIYFGRASEVEDIRRKNPNLDFGVAILPQLRSSNIKITQGNMMGVGISKQTKNLTAAFSVASGMAGTYFVDGLANDLLVAPAHKDLLKNKPDDALRSLVYNSAIISRSWIDPAPEKTNDLFRTMIRNINSGAQNIDDAINRTDRSLKTILDQSINTISQ